MLQEHFRAVSKRGQQYFGEIAQKNPIYLIQTSRRIQRDSNITAHRSRNRTHGIRQPQAKAMEGSHAPTNPSFSRANARDSVILPVIPPDPVVTIHRREQSTCKAKDWNIASRQTLKPLASDQDAPGVNRIFSSIVYRALAASWACTHIKASGCGFFLSQARSSKTRLTGRQRSNRAGRPHASPPRPRTLDPLAAKRRQE